MVRSVSGLFLLDGNSLTYRAFFAIPRDMVTASGQETNAVFGFTQMLISLMREHEPDGVAVAFDRPGGTFRHDRLPSYKANREKQEDSLYQQLDLVRELVDALGLLVTDADGFEADDVIATLATVARDAGRDVTVVTGDRDSYQLVEDPHVQVLYNKRGVSDYALYDEAGILPTTWPTRPSGATRRTTCPGCPGWGRRRQPSLLMLTEAWTESSPRQTTRHPNSARTSPRMRSVLASTRSSWSSCVTSLSA